MRGEPTSNSTKVRRRAAQQGGGISNVHDAGRSLRLRRCRLSDIESTWSLEAGMERPATGALATVSEWMRGARVRLRRVLRQFRN